MLGRSFDVQRGFLVEFSFRMMDFTTHDFTRTPSR